MSFLHCRIRSLIPCSRRSPSSCWAGKGLLLSCLHLFYKWVRFTDALHLLPTVLVTEASMFLESLSTSWSGSTEWWIARSVYKLQWKMLDLFFKKKKKKKKKIFKNHCYLSNVLYVLYSNSPNLCWSFYCVSYHPVVGIVYVGCFLNAAVVFYERSWQLSLWSWCRWHLWRFSVMSSPVCRRSWMTPSTMT